MFVLLGVLAIVSASLGVVLIGLHRAPEGYEDENGFHLAPVKRPAGAILSRGKRPTSSSETAGELQLPKGISPAKG